jgi:hypothetical protein
LSEGYGQRLYCERADERQAFSINQAMFRSGRFAATRLALPEGGPGSATEGRRGPAYDLVSRDVARPLRETPTMPERVGYLPVSLSPEGVAERLNDLRARINRAAP